MESRSASPLEVPHSEDSDGKLAAVSRRTAPASWTSAMMLMLAQACVNVLVLVTFDTWN